MLRVPDDGELGMLELIILSQPFEMKLYQNEHEGSDADLASDFTELERAGYKAVALERDEWRLTPGKPALAVHPPVRWRFPDGPEAPIRGYYVTWAATGRLAWWEPLKRAQIVEFEGDSITIVPKFTLRDLRDA